MKAAVWAAFCGARDHYRQGVETFRRRFPGLKKLQQQLADHRGGPAYTVKAPLVYNLALDDLGPGDEIRLILVADNPGRREQETGRYLVGPSGKIAEGFFRNTPELGIDMRRQVLILNKTPVHSPRTVELKELCRLGGPPLAVRIAESERFMASILLEFHRALSLTGPIPVWITGYSEMKKGGIFQAYTEALKEIYGPGEALRAWIFLYRHFSMNQFSIDLRGQAGEGEGPQDTLDRIGRAYRRRILGW